MKYDTSETGWRTILKDYMANLLEKFIQEPQGFTMTSGEAFAYETEQLKKQDRTISRASIIMGLNEMIDMGILTFRQKTGKGGYHRVYSLARSPKDLEVYVVANVLQRVKDTWPEAYREVVKVV